MTDMHTEDTRRDGLRVLRERVRGLGPIRMAVVHPCDETSLRAALDARREGLIAPILVAPRARLEQTAGTLGVSLRGIDYPGRAP